MINFILFAENLLANHISASMNSCAKSVSIGYARIFARQRYVWDETKTEIDVRYENCLECGACRVACDGIEWANPAWGTGIAYKNS